jgi:hypothetical protein
MHLYYMSTNILDLKFDNLGFINNNEIKILAGGKVEFPQQQDFIDLNIID